ncbi:MAG: DUF488 family protein [Planctomycetes bacterium]|nr:DUF488 family protein [Planctomycetota bacterium]
MLVRQKIILAILSEAQRTLSRIKLVKLAFLLGQETSLRDDHTYYDFVPYKYGPFSFALYRELFGLRRNGYVSDSEKAVELCPAMRDSSEAKVDELPSHARAAVSEIVREYGKMSQPSLLKWVYSEYPWYTIHSELRDFAPAKRPKRPQAPIGVYTSGYEGKSVDRFFDELIRAGIEAVLDVRCNPVSRKYGFARSSMRDIGEKLGIAYHHLPELGIASDERVSLDDYKSYQRLLNRYESRMLPRQPEAIERVIDLLQQVPSVMVCMEKDVECCHRGRLAKHVAEKMQLPIKHL